MKKARKRRTFTSREVEDAYWMATDSTAVADWSQASRPSFPRLNPTVRVVSIRLPQSMIDALKMLAKKLHVPYQALMKTNLADRIQVELGSRASSRHVH
jgi:hypothetical protein